MTDFLEGGDNTTYNILSSFAALLVLPKPFF